MNKRQKEVLQHELDAEKEVIKQLQGQYRNALNDINKKIRLLQSDELTTSKIYQIEYQKALKGQIEGILDKLHGDEYGTVQQYLKNCYTTGFVGTAYDMAGQGVPLIMPIDQAAVVRAIQTDSKISEGLYDKLGVDTKDLKKVISAEVSRGIATALPYSDIARNIANVAKAPLANAKRIARTEGHRISQASAMDAQRAAKAKGADVLKQWDSTLDGNTRDTHRLLDGQIREIEEPFEVGGMTAMYPGDFGDPAEDCNCRCATLTRARWALDETELDTLKERAAYFGLDKTKDFEDFQNKYLNAAAKPIENSDNSSIITVGRSLGAAAKNYPVKLPGSKQRVKLAEGQEIKGTVFAGKGTDEEVRDRFWLEATYHIPADDWQKVSGDGVVVVKGKNRKAELHWYQAEDQIVEMKVKRFKDES